MSPTLIQSPPLGYRFLLSHETERLAHGNPVLLYNGEVCHGIVKGFGDATMTVELRSGALVTLDLDDPDLWADDEVRERRPPMDNAGEFVAIREVLATPDEEIEPLLRAGVALAISAKDDPELQSALATLRQIITNRLRGKAA